MQNREIKFRVWDKVGNSFIKSCGHCIRFDTSATDILGHQFSGYVKDYTIQQYTGLKDKNGKEIYEGDYLKLRFPSEKGITVVCEVIFDKGSFIFRNPKVHPLDMAAFEEKDGKYDKIKPEVCGNCFENPEMSSSLGYFKDLSQSVTAATNN